MNKQREIKPGQRYGRLVTIRDTGEKHGTKHVWMCQCDCGNVVKVDSNRLGKTTNSCGCLARDIHTTHHMSDTRLYNIWKMMKRRCNNSSAIGYKHYGGRGITYCDEWEHFEPFYEWAIDNGYDDKLTIDRIDNDGNYCPENCRWTTRTVQSNNRTNWGETDYYGIVRDNNGYRAQVTVNGEKVYIAHSKDDLEYLIRERNKYIIKNNLPNKLNPENENYLHNYKPVVLGSIDINSCKCPILDVNGISYMIPSTITQAFNGILVYER